MTKSHEIPYGSTLNADAKKLVAELRGKFRDSSLPPIPKRYDTDFNLMRWILTAQRLVKSRDVIDTATKNLANHIRFRNGLHLDEAGVVPTWDENPLFKQRLFPYGQLTTATDGYNRLLWFIEYRTINLDGIVHVLKTSEMIRFQFWQYDYMLQKVMEQEEATGRMSGVRHVVDLAGFHINPVMMLFVSGGNVAYYSQLLHYEHYPDLVTPTDIVNAGSWITLPYRVVKNMMPSGFSQRFRLHGTDFLAELGEEIRLVDIPQSLGGESSRIACQDARTIADSEHWRRTENDPAEEDLHHLVINPRRRKIIPVQVTREGARISWYFTTDGDLFFGVYKLKHATVDEAGGKGGRKKSKHAAHADDEMELVYPFIKLAAKLVPEGDTFVCRETGEYAIVFCNRASWLTKRNVKLHVSVEQRVDRGLLERTISM